jgi:hypothetical protein
MLESNQLPIVWIVFAVSIPKLASVFLEQKRCGVTSHDCHKAMLPDTGSSPSFAYRHKLVEPPGFEPGSRPYEWNEVECCSDSCQNLFLRVLPLHQGSIEDWRPAILLLADLAGLSRTNEFNYHG